MAFLAGDSTKKHSPQPSPFLSIDRATWARLAPNVTTPISGAQLEQLRGQNDPIDLNEVAEVYWPLSRLLNLYATNVDELHTRISDFLGTNLHQPTPFVIGIAGSVAVGKSTVARVLRELLAQWGDTPNVSLVTTDGFLYPNSELDRRGLMNRKGFPESYDRKSLLKFVASIKGGAEYVEAPKYSHLIYDIVPNQRVVVERPDVLIVEGLNVLQQPPVSAGVAVSDFFDFTIYVDARTSAIKQWYVDRFLKLQRSSFSHPDSYFHRYASLSTAQATAYAMRIWDSVNEPNLQQNILPTRSRASLVLRKASDHSVDTVLLRKL